MASSADRKVISYIADIKDVKRKLKELKNLNSRFSKGVGDGMSKEFTKVGKSLGSIKTTKTKQGLNDLANTSTKTQQTFKKLDGSLVSVTKNTRVNAKGVAQTTTAYKDLNQNTKTVGQNMAILAKRAALTIPLWLALRGAVMGTFRTLSDGIKTISSQDEALQKARYSISGTTASVEGNFQTLEKAALSLSLKTGKSVEDIVNSFQKFATVGFDFDTSLTGANSAVKLSVALFGDAEEAANAFARSMRVLVDRSDGAASAGEQITNAMALTAEIYKDNAFTLSEFTGDLEKFAGTAKTTNITTRETIALLATLSTAGLRKRGGRLLRTSVQKLLGNLDKLAGTLGVKVNPALDSTFDVLLRVITEIDNLQASTGALGPATNVIKEIFGGVKSSEVVRALIALRTELEKNMEITADVDTLNAAFEYQNKQINRLTAQFTNLNREMGKAFVVGIVGGKDYQRSLETIIKIQASWQANMKAIGTGLRIVFKAATLQLGNFGNEFEKLNEIQLSKAEKKVESLFGLSTIKDVGVIRDLLENLDTAVPTGIFGVTEGFQKEIQKILEKRVIQLEDISTKQEDIANATGDEVKEQKKLVELQRQPIAKLILDNKLAELKLNGALQSQILKANSILVDRLGIEEQTIDKISRQLELERALSEERRLQSELGNESLQLFRIAQESGSGIAKQIGDVLSGDVDFSSFIRRGGEAVDIFKDKFSGVFEQQQAQAYFKGNVVPGAEKLRGGYGVDIREEAIRNRFTPTSAVIREKKAEGQFLKAEAGAKVTAPVTIINNIDISKIDEVGKQVANRIAAELPKVGTKVNTALKNALLGKQAI